MDYSQYYYRPNRKKSKAKSGLGARIAAICCIAAGFGLFILIYAFSYSPQGFLTTDAARGEIRVAGGAVYALEMGSYSSKTAAESAAQALRARGGAGYVRQSGAEYRVVAAVYAKRADRDSVADALAAGGEACSRAEWKIPVCSVKAGIEKKDLEASALGLQALYDNFNALESVWRKLDGGEYALSEASEQAASCKAKLDAAAAALTSASGPAAGKILAAVQAESARLAASVSAAELKFWAAAGADAFIRLLGEIS